MVAPSAFSQPSDGLATTLGKTGMLLGSQDVGVNSAEAAVEKARVQMGRQGNDFKHSNGYANCLHFTSLSRRK